MNSVVNCLWESCPETVWLTTSGRLAHEQCGKLLLGGLPMNSVVNCFWEACLGTVWLTASGRLAHEQCG